MSQEQEDRNGNKVLVAIGGNADSNAGGVRETVEAGLVALAETFAGMDKSALYQTPAFPAGSGPDFVNAAVVFFSDLAPDVILAALHRIEAEFGRTRIQRWGQRTLDLDLIAVGDRVAPHHTEFDLWRTLPLEAQKTQTPDRLILPHPRLQDRAFVLVPLADVAADWVHPVIGQSVAQMLAALPTQDRLDVTPI